MYEKKKVEMCEVTFETDALLGNRNKPWRKDYDKKCFYLGII